MKSPTTINPYETLGVNKNSTPEEIQSAYKTKIKDAHPDVGGNEELCKNLNAARDILLDEEKKAEYDNRSTPRHNIRHDPFESFFSQFMGGININMDQNRGFSFHQQQIISAEGIMTIPQMIFGDKEYTATTPHGKIKFNLPPKTEPGKTFHLKVSQTNNSEIILQLHMVLKMPEQLTTEQEKIVRGIT